MPFVTSLFAALRPSRLLVRFAAYVIGFSSVIAVVITSVELGSEYLRDLRQIDARIQQIETAYLPSVVENVWVNDRERLDVLLQGITRLPDFVLAEVSVDGQVELSHGDGLEGAGVTHVFLLQRQHQGHLQTIGELKVAATYDNAFHRALGRLTYFALTNGLKTLLVVGFIFVVYHRLLGRHLKKVARHATKQGRSTHTLAPAQLVLDRTEPRRPDELSRLVVAINRMQQGLLTLTRAQHERALELEHELVERRGLERRLRIMATAFQRSREAIIITDADNRIMATNQAFTTLTGYEQDEVLGGNPKMLSAGLTPTKVYQEMWHSLQTQGFWQGEIWDRRKDGKVYPKWLSINTVTGDQGEVLNYIAIFSDISERKQAEERIYELAHSDSLTGLSNRLSLSLELRHALYQAERDRQSLAVVFIDLDRFKEINDLHGHDVGDQLLMEVARRLTAAVRHGDVVARLGGDEFVLVLRLVNDRDTVARVADKVRRSMEQPYQIGVRRLVTSSSIGVAMYPADGNTPELLMKHADTAMYHAKATGRNNVQFYTEGMELALQERVKMVGELRQALESGQFELHYQPQFAASGGRLVGFEALLRWHHPEQGMVSPARFIPVAEQSGLILPLGEWVLDEACRQLRQWREETGRTDIRMSVNLSAQQLSSPTLIAYVTEVLGRHGLPPSGLELEITESMLMEDVEASIATLGALRDMGVSLSIDDFGTGYSSLSYLKLLPIHHLKLDRSFVKDVEQDASNAAICISTIHLAHNLGLQVIAEGVETQAQRDFLRDNGCDMLQGYLLARPAPAGEAVAHLMARV